MDSAFLGLTQALAKLPGLGRRSAERAALALVRRNDGLIETLEGAIRRAREDIRLCSVCGGLTEKGQDPCAICASPQRDGASLCVVEEPGDIMAIERCGAFRGRYHALHGKLAAGRNAPVVQQRVASLVKRIERLGNAEVILALSTDLEGDATAGYIAEQLLGLPVRITRLAFGLPAGSGVCYSDPLTLKRALGGRQAVAGSEESIVRQPAARPENPSTPPTQ